MTRPDLNQASIQKPENWEEPSRVDTYSVAETPALASLAEVGVDQLYACGVNLAEINPEGLYGIVGSREISEAEYMMAYQLAYAMGSLGYTDVSGFAEGADTAGHVGAIAAANLPAVATLGVLSGPINKLYLPERKEYASDQDYQAAIAARRFRARTVTKLAGALLTEYPVSEAKDVKWDHLGRNRITARLAITPDRHRHLVTVGGSVTRGGTLNTVNHALRMGGRVLLLAAPDQVYAPRDLVGHYRQNPDPRVLITENVQTAVDILTGGKEG